MLFFKNEQIQEVYRHGEETYPQECCGVLVGLFEDSKRLVQKVYRTKNLNQQRNDRYEMDLNDRLKIEAEASKQGLSIVGFYHSHPDHEAYFSQTDLEGSEEYRWGEPWLPPTYAYLVVSVQEKKAKYYKAFLIQDGKAVEEKVSLQ